MLMDLESRKYEFIRQLIEVEEPGIMDRLEEILKQETSSGRDSIAQYNKDLDEAIEEIEKVNSLLRRKYTILLRSGKGNLAERSTCSFKKHYNHIKKDSLKSAMKVVQRDLPSKQWLCETYLPPLKTKISDLPATAKAVTGKCSARKRTHC